VPLSGRLRILNGLTIQPCGSKWLGALDVALMLLALVAQRHDRRLPEISRACIASMLAITRARSRVPWSFS
jgi:hypothetical protein